jgi:hypothetical protein
MAGANEDPLPLAVEGRPVYKRIDKFERAGDINCLEPAWKEHWEELRVDMLLPRWSLRCSSVFGALLEETTAAFLVLIS